MSQKLRGWLLFVLLGVIWFFMTIGIDSALRRKQLHLDNEILKRVVESHAKGVNDALQAVMLLDLEQKMQGTNRTWGAMADIVRQRLNVKPDDVIAESKQGDIK